MNSPAEKNRRVLVIDDNHSIHDDFRKILSPLTGAAAALEATETVLFGQSKDPVRHTQFEIDSAYQGQEGVMLVKKALEARCPYAMAFVDIRMPPGWDGVETTQNIWAIDPDIQIVICTAYSDYSWDEMFEKLGHRDGLLILKKPFDTVEALQLAHALTEKWWLHQQAWQKMEELESQVAQRTSELQQTNHALQTEIAEHKRSEALLRESEVRKNSIVQSSLDCIVAIDHECKILEFNPAAEKVFGYARAEVLGRELAKVIIPPALRERHRAGMRHYLATREGRIIGKRIELTAIRSDGSEFPVELAIARSGTEEPPIFTGFIRDITERRQAEAALREAEAKYRSIFENSNDGVFQTTLDGRFISANPAMARILGFASPEELILERTDIERQGYAESALREKFQRLIEERGFINGFEYEAQRKDGTRIWVSENTRNVRDAAGHTVYYEGSLQDITARKRAETVSQALVAIIESSDDVIIGKDLNSIVTSWNKSAEKIFGYTASEMVGTSILRLMPSSLRDEDHHIVSKIKRGEVVEHFDTLRLTKGGAQIDLSVTASPIKDATGRVIGVSIVGREIGARRRAEESLRASEANMAAAQRIAHFGSWELELTRPNNINDNTLRWSDEMFRIAGYEPGTVAVTNQLFFRHVPVEEHESIRRAVADAIRDRHLYSIVHRLIRPDGEVRVVRDAGQIVFDETGGKALKIVGTTHDITEQRKVEDALERSEREQRHLAEQLKMERARLVDAQAVAKVGSWETDLSTFAVIWSRETHRIFETDPKTFQRTHEGFLRFVHPEDRSAVDDAFRQSFNQHSACAIEHRILLPDGRIKFLEERWRIFFDDEGKPVRALGTCQDITDRKRIEDHLFQSQKIETVGKLAGGIAHELNSLLTVIIGQSELLLDDLPVESPLAKNAAEINKAAGQIATLTRQLLAFGRKQTLLPEILDLNAVLAEMESTVRHLMGRGTEVRIVPATGLKAVKADAGQIRQVIVNMAMNAADAMPGKGKLTIETANVKLDTVYVSQFLDGKAGDYVRLAIIDTGMGMSKEVAARIFEPFFSTKEVGKGTGLGLSTCYGIIKQSGGHLTVETEPGRGTIFKIYLPQVEQRTEIPVERLDTPDLPRGTETILLVEDDPALREMAAVFLRRLGYTVLAAGNGVEALTRKQENDVRPVDLLITNVEMPQMSGTELAGRVRKLFPHARILFTATYAEIAMVQQGGLNKSEALLQKPFNPSALARKVWEVLDQSSAPNVDTTQKTVGFPKTTQ